MKKTVQPVMKKVYAQPSYAQNIQMNAVRKINSLLSSGTVSVTGPSQTRIVKQQPAQPKTVFVQKGECYICDEHIGNNGTLVTEAFTTVSNTKIPTKIGRIVGDAFMVIVSVDDVICKRCLTMFNQMDRLETDLDRVKSNILTLINKKYGINDNGNTGASSTNVVDIKPPPAKVQRLNTSSGAINTNYINRKTSNGGEAEDDRKITTVPLMQPIQTQQMNQFAGGQRVVSVSGNDAIDGQLTGLYETSQQNSFGQTQVVRQQQPTATQRKPIKIYKCMSCDFKTTDIKLFQPHYDTCRQQNGYRCKICKKLFTSVSALKAHNVEKHASEFTCSICNINYMNEATYKKHMETNHPDIKTIESSTAVASGQLYTCNICTFKTYEKATFDAHSRKHVKVKPFKCRICSARFETRELAGVHAKTHCADFFKCGTCSSTFTSKEQLVKHFEVHKQQQQVAQKQQIVSQIQTSTPLTQPIVVSQDLTTQKLLQDTIDEALRETGSESGPKINFYSCHICSLTFIQESYYKQHMTDTHKREINKKTGSQAVAVTTSTVSNTHSLIRTDQRVANTPTTIIQTQPNTSISDNDLEIMFEKMHSDKAEIEGNANNTEGVVITSHESSTGGYTFNITMANQDANTNNVDADNKAKQEGADGLAPVAIDMPQLDQSDEQQLELQHQQQQQQPGDQEQQTNSEQQHQEHLDNEQKLAQGVSVSMPSLDDDADGSQPSSSDQVPMDLEDIQNAAESGQIKFILNENGQLLQLDQHILTTDSEGNQILVQDSEQIQQLLQSCAVLQADGEGGEQTFQMIQGENQMILVQGDNNEAQLIDASMLNEDGQLVIQHHGDELPQGMHVVNEDGVQVPVSIAFAQHLESAAVEHHQQQEQHELQHQDGEQEIDQKSVHHADQQQHGEEIEAEQAVVIKSEDTSSQDGEQQATAEADSGITTVTTSTRTSVTSTTGEVYFSLDEIMNQSEQK